MDGTDAPAAATPDNIEDTEMNNSTDGPGQAEDTEPAIADSPMNQETSASPNGPDTSMALSEEVKEAPAPSTENKTHKKLMDVSVEEVQNDKSGKTETQVNGGEKENSGVEKEKKPVDARTESAGHRVTFTVTIAQAIPTVDEGDAGSDGRDTKKRKRIVEAPRAQNYFHCEYDLLPGNEETVRTDVVTYGVAAKIYTERQDAKVLKTWKDGAVTWLAWTHTHSLNVTDELLQRLFGHTLRLRVWDTKDKLSARARYDRPKAFKLPQAKPGEDAENAGGVKSLVLRQCGSFAKLEPRRTHVDRPMPSATPAPAFPERDDPPPAEQDAPELPGKGPSHGESRGTKRSAMRAPQPVSPTPTTLIQVPVEGQVDREANSFSRLGRLAGVEPPREASATKRQTEGRNTSQGNMPGGKKMDKPKPSGKGAPAIRPQAQNGTDSDSNASNQGGGPEVGPGGRQSSRHASRQPSRAKGHNRKTEAAAAQAAAEVTRQQGVCSLSVSMAKFFAGLESITERLAEPIPGVEDLFVTVSLNTPLLSEAQRRELNPMVLTVQSASAMPSTPLSLTQLRHSCQPAYIKYQIFDLPEHRSVGREQDENIYWDDVNVVLAGTMESARLRECLMEPPLQIEIHDRDRRLEKQCLQPALFGDDLADDKIANVGTVASKRTVHNAFHGRDTPWDPYGVGRLDLSGFLLGQTLITARVPIHQCPTPDVLGLRDPPPGGRVVGVAGAMDGPADRPLPPGHYMKSDAMLKVKVQIAHALVTPSDLAVKKALPASSECPFARLVFKFDYKNVDFLNELQALVTSINARALGLEAMSPEVIQAALSTYKLSVEQQEDPRLDIVTGFQILDGELHLFVLEGLRHDSMLTVREALPKPAHSSDVQVLYHSDMAFHTRLYGSLDVDLCRIKLHEPLSVIVQQPLLYVRDMVPAACFQALLKLDQLCQSGTLSSAVRNDVLPAAEMVLSLSKEFGVPFTALDHQELQSVPMTDQGYQSGWRSLPQDDVTMPTRSWTPIDNYNLDYEETLEGRLKVSAEKDYIRQHKTTIEQRSVQNRLERSKTMPATIRINTGTAHNYSSQTLNTTEQAMEKLRQHLAQEADRRYTYCPDYHHSMTVEPVDVDTLRRQEALPDTAAWKTPQGFVYPGKKTMIESNKHPRRPHEARVDELQESWEENQTLHFKPKLDRGRFPWKLRREDLDVWTRPAPVFGRDEPVTIHLAGQKLKEEKSTAVEREREEWRSKVIVDDLRAHFHRCAIETELRESGFASCHQMARLRGLLKDPPQKYSLRKPGFRLKDVPPLSVVQNPSVDPEGMHRDRDRPGAASPRGRSGPMAVAATDPAARVESGGFIPGPYEGYSWTQERNHIPVRDYQHQLFESKNGQDFNVYHKTRSALHRRRITQLTDPEYNTHLFKQPSRDSGFKVGRQYSRDVIPDVRSRQVTQDTMDSGFVSLITPTPVMTAKAMESV